MFALKHAVTGAALAVMLAGGAAQAQMGQPNMMGDHMPMMGQSDMMGQMSMMGMGRQGGMGMPFEHVEGRIAYLKAELKIDDAQAGPWNAFADVMRANAKSMGEMHAQMMPSGSTTTLPQRVDMHEKMMAAHLEMQRKFQAAVKPLYAALNDQQKQVADALIKGMCGM